ncbi:MAG: glycosyltransferase family 2 protein [Planctomycetota bacterium]
MSNAPQQSEWPLSGVLVVMNEAAHIEACLRSMDFCDEWVVVDSHSSDRTREIAAAFGARVIERDWPGFGPQKIFAVEAASHDWVLVLDADERVSPALREEILALKRGGTPAMAGYNMPRLCRAMGRWIRHGSWYPDRVLRLFDRRRGNYNDARVHEKVIVHGPVGELKADLLHLPYVNMAAHLAKMERYTDEMALKSLAKGRRARWFHVLFAPPLRFFKFYVLQSSWRDGWQGFVLACLAAHYAGLKYLKLYVHGLPQPPADEDPATFDQTPGGAR